uniref:Uncharacterized protein n=2 Tax=Haplochromini TaxID=319058 RepID=A0A3P9CZL7_9CICH
IFLISGSCILLILQVLDPFLQLPSDFHLSFIKGHVYFSALKFVCGEKCTLSANNLENIHIETIGFYSWQKRKISEEQNAASLNLFPQEQPLCFSIYSIHLLLYNSHLHANPAISLRLLFTLVNSLGSHSNALDFDFAVSAAATIDVKGFCMAGIIYTTVFMREMYLRTVSTF